MSGLPGRLFDSRRFALSWSALRVAFALLSLAAVGYLYSASSDDPTFSAGNYFSFFTIQSNLIAAAVLLFVALRAGPQRSRGAEYLRGAATLYISITGVVFAVLLAGLQEDLNTAVVWGDFVVHKLTPIVLVVDWLVDPPQHRLPRRLVGLWLLYPLAYLVYTLIRGPIVDWYPYPFVDVDSHGYGGVAWRCVILLVGFLAASSIVLAVGNWLHARRSRTGTARPAARYAGSTR